MKYSVYYYLLNIPKTMYTYQLQRSNKMIQIIPNYYLLDDYDKKHDIFHYNTKYRRNFKNNVFKKHLVDNHHIIPKQFVLHPLIQQLKIDVSCSKNILFLPNRFAKELYYHPKTIYHDSHPKYNKYIQKQLDSWQYDFAMTNQLAGKDPAGGTVKVLDLKYKLNGKTYTKKIRENGTVSFIE